MENLGFQTIREFEERSLELSQIYETKIQDAVDKLTTHLELVQWGTNDIRYDALIKAYVRLMKSKVAERT